MTDARLESGTTAQVGIRFGGGVWAAAVGRSLMQSACVRDAASPSLPSYAWNGAKTCTCAWQEEDSGSLARRGEG